MPNFNEFEEHIGVHFNNQELLTQAFVHRSYLNENPSFSTGHNERLEFLGDAVLELAVTDYLYRSYSQHDEGLLTAYRAALVNAVTMAEVAQEAGMNEYLLLSRGEAKDTGRARQVILANACEALIGALYLDQGYTAAEAFITRYLLPKTEAIIKNHVWQDAKSSFQERAQDERGITPVYRVLSETGPDHQKRFTVGVYLGEELVAKGGGPAKQEAEQEAARKALEQNGWRSRDSVTP